MDTGYRTPIFVPYISSFPAMTASVWANPRSIHQENLQSIALSTYRLLPTEIWELQTQDHIKTRRLGRDTVAWDGVGQRVSR